MENPNITRLFPLPNVEQPLTGLCMDHDLRGQAQADRPFIYSNYVRSLDSRIAIPHPTKPGLMVPKQIANPRDWRLFQEMAVQADVLITSGRYLRDYEDGRAQEILQVYENPDFADLKEWRLDNGLPLHPDLAVISGSLSFPIPKPLTDGERSLLVYTTSRSNPERRLELEAQGAQVIVAGDKGVDGRLLAESLAGRGYRTAYNTTGPKVLHLLLAAGVLDRLYLTQVPRILGGDPYASVVEGPLFDPPLDFRLSYLYLDPYAIDGLGQLFTAYDRLPER